jgi:diguanylate cyclase (GGDEF)-like protein/PAS domain S-box-containing protein
MRNLFARQLAKATRESGEIDLGILGELVVKAYDKAERERCRKDRSIAGLNKELGVVRLQLTDALDVIPEGIALFDADDRYIMWNRRYSEIYAANHVELCAGMLFEDTLRAGLADKLHTDAVGREEAWVAERLERHRQPSNTHEQQLEGDRWVRVEERRTANGGSVGVRIDITDLKHREESFRLLFENNPIPMFVCEADTLAIIAVNEAAVIHYGYRRDELFQMAAFDLRILEDREDGRQIGKSGAGFHQSGDIRRHIKADGTKIDVSIYSRPLKYDGRSAIFFSAIDITERLQARATLLEQKLQIDTAINNMSQGLLMFDQDARLVLCNQRYIDMYELSREVVKPGCLLRELLNHRKQRGFLPGDPDEYNREVLDAIAQGRGSSRLFELPEGRFIQVESRPMLGGGWVATHEDITERRVAQNRIEYLAHHDSLTGLPNRASFNERIAEAFQQAVQRETSFAVVCIDLDRFKEINDVFGHAVGDRVLKEIGHRLRNASGGVFVSRLSGDEFSMIVTDGKQPGRTEELATRLQASIAEEFYIDGHLVQVGLSIGVAIYPTDGSDVETLLANGDAALYRSKRDGRGSVRFFEAEMDRHERERRALQHDLRSAIDRNELSLFYQPQATINGTIIGFEALMRWHHPVRGWISPDVFIPLAEENGLIMPMGEWLFREACSQAMSWPEHLHLAVNVSPVQFQHGDLPALVHATLLATGLSPRRLELEITEGVLIDDFSRAISILQRLKILGVRIALDDFGTGYSSLRYLQAFPFAKIKIDKSFISQLEQNTQSQAIIRAVIGLARGLSLPVLAEGVETEEQLAFLVREACDEVQGYLIGRPRPIEYYSLITSTVAPAQKKHRIA